MKAPRCAMIMTLQPPRRRIPPETKMAIVRRFQAGEKGVDIAREFDVQPSQISRWVQTVVITELFTEKEKP